MNQNIAILQLMHAQGLGSKTLSNILIKLYKEQIPLEEIVYTSSSDLIHLFNIRPEVAQSIKDNQEGAYQLSDELDNNYIRIIVKGSEQYPSKLSNMLKRDAPPVLFTAGNLEILEKKSVGFCGSRNVSENGRFVASESSAELAKSGVNVISGYAKGIDTAAHEAAMNAGGVTTIVLATGILHFKMKKIIAETISGENHLIISEFIPRLGWAARNAMQRNRIICGLSDVVIIIESGLNGGTFEAGKKAIELRRPLFVAEYADPRESATGNSYFLKRGAIPLRKNKEGKPKLNHIFEALKQNNSISWQKSLF